MWWFVINGLKYLIWNSMIYKWKDHFWQYEDIFISTNMLCVIMSSVYTCMSHQIRSFTKQTKLLETILGLTRITDSAMSIDFSLQVSQTWSLTLSTSKLPLTSRECRCTPSAALQRRTVCPGALLHFVCYSSILTHHLHISQDSYVDSCVSLWRDLWLTLWGASSLCCDGSYFSRQKSTGVHMDE